MRLAQLPDTQLALITPGRVLQLLLQPPQAVAVLVMFTSQPSADMLLQLACVGLHELMPQVPPEHTLVALGRVQATPQLEGCTGPQLFTSVSVFTQLPEQLTVPAWQVDTQVPLEQT